MSLKDAFTQLLSIHKRQVTLVRQGQPSVAIAATPSNWFRATESEGEMIIDGKEYVIPVKQATTIALFPIRRGDMIIDGSSNYTIDRIREMYDLGGEVIGWRVQTS